MLLRHFCAAAQEGWQTLRSPPSLQQGENRQKMLMLSPGLSAAAPVGMEQQRLARKESNGRERMEL